MFFNRNVFMIISSIDVKFATVEHIPSQTAKQINISLNKLMKLYGRVVLVIRVILVNMKFEKVAGLLGNVEY